MLERQSDAPSGLSVQPCFRAAFEEEPLILTRNLALGITATWRRWGLRSGSDEQTELSYPPLLLLSFLPLAIDVCLRLVHQGSSWRGFAWMVIAATLLSLLLVTAPWAWQRIGQLAGPLDRMLEGRDSQAEANGCSHDAVRYLGGVTDRLRLRRSHYFVCLVVALGALAGTYVASRQLPHGTFGPVFYAYAAVLGGLGADSLRWMLRLPLILLQPLTRVPRLRVVMHSPATTPAIREMAQLAAETAARASLGLFIVGLWLLWEVFSGKPYHGSGLSYVERLALVDLGPLIVSAAVVIYVTFVPQYWLSEIVGKQRDRILDELCAELPEAGPANLLSDDTQKVISLYDRIANTSTDTTEARVVIRRIVAVVAVLAPQLIAVGAKLLHIG